MEFSKHDAGVLSFAIDTVLPSLVLSNSISKEDEEFLFDIELKLLNCSGFSIQFNFQEEK